MKYNKKKRLFIAILCASLYGNFALLTNTSNPIPLKVTAKPHQTKVVIQSEPQEDNLTDWDIFTLALMKVESEYDSSAVSEKGARGYFQITPIYVEEVNRIYDTNYKFKDVTNFETAYEIFDLMQQAHNPGYDMDKALELHNGDHDWYDKRVYDAMAEIKKYEKMRNKVKYNLSKECLL